MSTTIVTGSASGIGAAVCKLLQDAGKKVVGVDIAKADVQADLSTSDGRDRAVDDILNQCNGVLDGLVCCAGLGPTAKPASLIAAVNFFGATRLLDGLYPALQKGKNPAAVVVSSNSISHLNESWLQSPLGKAFLNDDEEQIAKLSDIAENAQIVYAGSKYAVTCHMRSLAESWGKSGVRLNAIAPGVVDTPLLQAGLDDPRFSQAIREFLPPMGRRADPIEIAEVIAFMMSPQASYLHGSVLFVDGGIDAVARPRQF